MKDPELMATLLNWSDTFLRLSMRDFHRFTRGAGLSLGQMTVLMHLYYQGPSEVTNFCEMLQITPAGASQMIERMVGQGVVQRAEVPGDRRVRLVSLTEQGRALVQESISARQAWVEDLVESLTPDEAGRITAALRELTDRAGGLEPRREKREE